MIGSEDEGPCIRAKFCPCLHLSQRGNHHTGMR
jgi:hypothetical protein